MKKQSMVYNNTTANSCALVLQNYKKSRSPRPWLSYSIRKSFAQHSRSWQWQSDVSGSKVAWAMPCSESSCLSRSETSGQQASSYHHILVRENDRPKSRSGSCAINSITSRSSSLSLLACGTPFFSHSLYMIKKHRCKCLGWESRWH